MIIDGDYIASHKGTSVMKGGPTMSCPFRKDFPL